MVSKLLRSALLCCGAARWGPAALGRLWVLPGGLGGGPRSFLGTCVLGTCVLGTGSVLCEHGRFRAAASLQVALPLWLLLFGPPVLRCLPAGLRATV